MFKLSINWFHDDNSSLIYPARISLISVLVPQEIRFVYEKINLTEPTLQ